MDQTTAVAVMIIANESSGIIELVSTQGMFFALNNENSHEFEREILLIWQGAGSYFVTLHYGVL